MSSKTYVDSVVYNLAGDELKIPNFLKSTIVGGILTRDSEDSMGRYINQSLVNGPGMKLLTFMRWAKKRNFTPDWIIGVPTDSLIRQDAISNPAVLPALRSYTGRSGGYFGLYLFTSSDDYIMSEAMMMYYEDRPSDYEHGDWYSHANGNEVTFVGMHSVPDEWGEYQEAYRVTYTVPTTHAGASYRHFHVFLSAGHHRATTYVYRVGSGYPDLELDFSVVATGNEYFPMIPLRLNNVMVDDPNNAWMRDTLFPQVEKGYKKAFGQDVNDLLDALKDNPNLNDIDYAFTIFAAPLNTSMESSRDYLFAFARDLYFRWIQATNLVSIYVSSPSYMFDPGSSGTQRRAMQVSMHWSTLDREVGTGLAWPGAISGQARVYSGGNTNGYHASSSWTYVSTDCFFVKQITNTTWERIRISNFKHRTHVYNGVEVVLTCDDVFNEPDQSEASGFLVPVSYQVLKDLSMKDAAQLALECNHIVLNCYVVRKKKWYEKGIFKVILIVVAIALAVWTGGGSLGATAGILGTNAAVGMAIGFTGLAAAIAGAVANMVAAMIVTRLITAASVELLGEEIGNIVGAIASFVAIGVGSGLQADGGTLSSAFSQLFSPENLANMTLAVGAGVTGAINANTLEVMQKTQDMVNSYQEQSKELKAQMDALMGDGSFFFDPTRLANVGLDQETIKGLENPSAFFARTMMTGMDIADITMAAPSMFTSLTLKTDLK